MGKVSNLKPILHSTLTSITLFSSANWLIPMPICLVGCLFLIDFRSEMYTYVYICTYTYIHAYTHIYTYIYMHIHAYTCIYAYVYVWVSQVALLVKNMPADAGDNKGHGFSPWVGKILWRRKGQLQYSCLENSMDRGAWWAPVPGVAELDMTEVTEPT